MKNIIKFFLGLLLCISLITGFSINSAKAETTVVSVQEVNSDLFIVTFLISGNVVTISMDGVRIQQVDIY